MALQVHPISRNELASRYSSTLTSNSSGKAIKNPVADLRFLVALYAFPVGLTPTGWEGTVTELSPDVSTESSCEAPR